MPQNEDKLIIQIDTEINESSVKKNIKKLEAEHKKLQTTLNKQMKTSGQHGAGIDMGAVQKTKQALAKSTVELNKQRQVLKQIDLLQVKQIANVTKTNAVSQKYTWSTNKTAQAIHAQEKSMKSITKELQKQSKISKAKGTGTTNGREGFSETMFGGAGTTFGHKLATTAQYATAGAILYKTAEAFGAATKAVIEFDTATRTLSAVLKLSINDSRALGQELNDLGKSFGGTLSDIYGVTNALGRAGVATEDLVAGTEIVIKMAKLTGDTFDQATSALVSYAQVFGTGDDGKLLYTMEELGDKLANIANASRMSTQDIGTFSNYALAAAKAVGLSLDGVSGLAIAFSNAGVNASTAGTQVRRFTSLLLDDGKVTTKFFNTMGITQKNFIYEMKKGVKESNAVMKSFATDLKNLSDDEFLNLMQGMDLLATNSLNLIRNNADEFTTAMSDSFSGVKGELNSVTAIIESTTGSWERFVNTVQDSAIDLAEAGNSLNLITGSLTSIAEWTGSLFASDEEKKITSLKFAMRALNLQLDTLNLSEEERANRERSLIKKAGQLASLKDIQKLNEASLALKLEDAEITRLLIELDKATQAKNKKNIAYYQKELDLIIGVNKEKKKEKDDEPTFIPPSVDPQILLNSIKALDAVGLSTNSTFEMLQQTITTFQQGNTKQIDSLLNGLKESSIISDKLSGNALESQSKLLGLLADGGKFLSGSTNERIQQISVIKNILKLLEETNQKRNIELQATKIINDSEFKKLVNARELDALNQRLIDGKPTERQALEDKLKLEQELLKVAKEKYGVTSEEAKKQEKEVKAAEIASNEFTPILDTVKSHAKDLLVDSIQSALDNEYSFKEFRDNFDELASDFAKSLGKSLLQQGLTSGDLGTTVAGATLMATDAIIGAGAGDDYVGPIERAEQEFDVFIESLEKASETLLAFNNVGSSTSNEISSLESEIARYSKTGGYTTSSYQSGSSRRYKATYEGQTFRSGERSGVAAQIEQYKAEQVRLLKEELDSVVVASLGESLDIGALSIPQLEELTAGIDIPKMEAMEAALSDLALEAKLGGLGFAESAEGIENAAITSRILKDEEYARYKDLGEAVDLLAESREAEIESTNDMISTLEGFLDVIENIKNKLRDIEASPEEDLQTFNDRMEALSNMDMTADVEAYAEALDKTIAATDVFFNTDNFASGRDQDYAKLIAANQFEDLQDVTLTELDVLKEIAVNTAILAEAALETVDLTEFTETPERRSIFGKTFKDALRNARGFNDTGTIAPSFQGFASGGYTGSNGVDDIAGVVHGQEYVVNAQTTKDLGLNEANGGVFKGMLAALVMMTNDISDMKQMQVKTTADTKRQLDTQRATLDELITLNEGA